MSHCGQLRWVLCLSGNPPLCVVLHSFQSCIVVLRRINLFSLTVNVWIDTFSVSTQTQPVTYFRARLVGDCSTPQVRCICSLENSRQWNAASWRRPVINPIQVSPNYQNGHRGTPFRQIIINSFPSRTEYEPYIRRCLQVQYDYDTESATSTLRESYAR